MVPEQDPHHWQRGLCYYYAEEYEKGKAQFERHQTVNSQDVENAVWHFLCAVRAPGGNLAAAQKELIPIEGDGRIPIAAARRGATALGVEIEHRLVTRARSLAQIAALPGVSLAKIPFAPFSAAAQLLHLPGTDHQAARREAG
jgi:hypothetical protein